MMKTKEELNALRKEVETLNRKLAGLSEDELKQVTGGRDFTDDTRFRDKPDAPDTSQLEKLPLSGF